MSCWTHITACLSVDTDITDSRRVLRKAVKDYLKNAPKITGSEGNADVFINIPSGYNFYTMQDCEHCEYKTPHASEYCNSPKDYDCKSGEYQTCVVISIQGDLRDKHKAETQKEFNEFLEYIKQRFYVRDYTVNIEGV